MPTEIESDSADSKATRQASELDPQALAAIRNLLDKEPEAVEQPAAVKQSAEASRTIAPIPEPKRAEPAPRRSARDPIDAEQPAPKRQVKGKMKRIKSAALDGGLMASITSYRPAPKHIVYAAFGLLLLFRPWLVAGLLFLGLFIMIGVFLILGYDGFWKRAMGFARWYAKRRPERAAEMHRKLDGFAMRWDAILDWFPEGSVDSLYLPDFGNLATADARHDKALERRFASLREGDA